jgi:hypothetical protein
MSLNTDPKRSFGFSSDRCVDGLRLGFDLHPMAIPVTRMRAAPSSSPQTTQRPAPALVTAKLAPSPEPWWVLPGQYPLGEHGRCRDWTAHPFPYARHIDELRKLWRKLTLPEQTGARMAIEGAGKALSAIGARWPADGAPGVAEADAILCRVRAALQAAGIDAAAMKRL